MGKAPATAEGFELGWWESAYEGSPPWDIGGPQPEIVKLVKNGEIKEGSRVLDIGCGLGDNAIFLAENGNHVTCLDIAHRVIEKGKAKADKRKVRVNFLVGNVLELDKYFPDCSFQAVVDSGLFHSLDDGEREHFAKQVFRILADGGTYFVLCFSDKEPGNWGPRRISKAEIRETFSGLSTINYVRDAKFASKMGQEGARAYLVSMTKTG